MNPTLQCLTLFAACTAVTAGASAQDPAFLVGNWQSATSETYTSPLHPVLTGAELYLKIDVSNDGKLSRRMGRVLLLGRLPGRLRNPHFPVPLQRGRASAFPADSARVLKV